MLRMRRMRVLLLALPSHRTGGGYSPALSLITACTLADPALRDRVVFKVVNACTPIVADLADLIEDFAPDLVGFSALVWNHQRIIDLARIVRERVPDAVLLAGCDNSPWLIQSHPDLFDLAIVGEGEASFLRLVRLLVDAPGASRAALAAAPRATLRGIPGVRLPRDAFVLGKGSYGETSVADLPPHHAQGYGVFVTDTMYLETLRGCPYHCTFCGIADASDRLRRLDPGVVEREIAWAAERGLRSVLLCDSAINYKTSDVERLLRLVEKYFPHGGFEVDAQFNFDFYRPEQLPLFKALPVEHVTCGLQTTSPSALAKMERGFNRDRFERFVEAVGAELPLRFDVILGLPGDTPEGFARTLEYLSQYPVELNVNVMNVMPQTEAWRQRVAWGLQVHEADGWIIRETPTFPAAELRAAACRVAAMARAGRESGFRVRFDPEVNQIVEVGRGDRRLDDFGALGFPFDVEDVRHAREVCGALRGVLQASEADLQGWSIERAFLLGLGVAAVRFRDPDGAPADLSIRETRRGPDPDLEVGHLNFTWSEPYEAHRFESCAGEGAGECRPLVGPRERRAGTAPAPARAELLARLAPVLSAQGAAPAGAGAVRSPSDDGALVVSSGPASVTLVLRVEAGERRPAFARGLGHGLSHVGASLPPELRDLVFAVGAAFEKLDAAPVPTDQARAALARIVSRLDPRVALTPAPRPES